MKNDFKILLISLIFFSFILNFYSCESCVKSKSPKSKRTSQENFFTDESEKINNFPDLVKKLERAIFLILVHDINNRIVGQGTGFFISKNGEAITNHHVFEKGYSYSVQLDNGKFYEVDKIISSSIKYDYVIFKVKSNEEFPFLKLAKNDASKGEDIFVIGNPKGLEKTLTKGIVSAYRDWHNKDDIIQFDAAVSSGSSGSPVFNKKGEVIGIATFKIFEDCESCNFAINIKYIEGLNK